MYVLNVQNQYKRLLYSVLKNKNIIIKGEEFIMKRIKKFVVFLLITVLALSLAACGGSKDSSGGGEEVIKLRLAGQHTGDHPATEALNRIKEKIEKDSDGRIQVTVYPSNQLGDYTLVYEEIMKGSIDMAHIFVPSQYNEKLEINSIPYLIENYEAMQKVFSPGSFFYETYGKMQEDLGVKLLGIYAEGFIGYGSKDLPENLKDPTAKKSTLIRTPAMDVYKLATEDMGYPSTTIAYADLYSALQTGVADGWVGGTALMNYLSFRDVIDNFIPYNCFIENTAYVMNNDLWTSLSDEDKNIINNAFVDESKNSFSTAKEEDAKALDALKESDINVVELTDAERKVIADHVRNTTWPKLEQKFGKDIMQGIKQDIE